MLVPNGSAPVDFVFDAYDPAGTGPIYCIDNASNIVGAIQLKKNNSVYPSYPQSKDIGFKINANSPFAKTNPQLIEDEWSAFKPGALIVRGLNSIGDIVGQIDSGTSHEAFIILNHGTASQIYVNVAAHPYFASLTPTDIVISGINTQRAFVGWHTTNGLQYGLFGKVDDAGNIIFLHEINHAGAVTANSTPLHGTQLFGITESYIMVGTFNNLLPFICVWVMTPPPPPGDRPPFDDLLTIGAEFIQKVYGSVAAGGRGPVTDYYRPPGIRGPDVPWMRDAATLLSAWEMTSRIKDPEARESVEAALRAALRDAVKG
jgi:hypothetical protein